MRTGRARTVVALVALAVLAAVAVFSSREPFVPPDRPNIILVLTDDQPADTLTSGSAGNPGGRGDGMPWLRSQLDDPGTGWLGFSDAYVTTPLCCPSRATILTGRYARHHGVTSNGDGTDLDESDTLPVWLHDAGYRTALIGKYLNEYPWDRGPYVPPGWDRWLAKTNESLATTYYGYGLVDQGTYRRVGRRPADHVVDVLGQAALDFVRTAPRDAPWFLYFAPPAPHPPWEPLPRDEGSLPVPPPPDEAVLNDVEGKPPWIRDLPSVDATRLAVLQEDRRRAAETLLGVDEYLEALVDAVAARGELDRTVVVFLSDNGYAFGEHRWEGKLVPYDPSIRIPFAVRSPWTGGGTVSGLVSNLDVAPTIAALAGVPASAAIDGISLADVIRGGAGTAPPRPPLLIEWAGGGGVPPWSGVVSAARTYVRWADTTEELYDRTTDPDQLVNLALDPGTDLEPYRAALAGYGPAPG